jgi:hypothetical protein
VDELAERRRREQQNRDEALRRLGLHPPTLVCDQELRHLCDRPPGEIRLIELDSLCGDGPA